MSDELKNQEKERVRLPSFNAVVLTQSQKMGGMKWKNRTNTPNQDNNLSKETVWYTLDLVKKLK